MLEKLASGESGRILATGSAAARGRAGRKTLRDLPRRPRRADPRVAPGVRAHASRKKRRGASVRYGAKLALIAASSSSSSRSRASRPGRCTVSGSPPIALKRPSRRRLRRGRSAPRASIPSRASCSPRKRRTRAPRRRPASRSAGPSSAGRSRPCSSRGGGPCTGRFQSDGRFVATAGKGGARVVPIGGGTAKTLVPRKLVTSVRFEPDGRFVVAATADGGCASGALPAGASWRVAPASARIFSAPRSATTDGFSSQGVIRVGETGPGASLTDGLAGS